MRNDEGREVVLNKNGTLEIYSKTGVRTDVCQLQMGAVLTIEDGVVVKKGDKVATWDPHSVPVLSEAHGERVVCVGSTSVRTLETVAAANGGEIKAADGWSSIFIYPPYKFAYTDAMLTNFHLPQSTLLMMISALAGRERVLSAYAMAVRAKYKFFSYGDCMLIL